MAIYFCISDVLDRLERPGGRDDVLDSLMDVGRKPLSCAGHTEDAMVLSSTPRLLDFESRDVAYQLGRLLDDVPLYRINMELALDEALSVRHSNVAVKKTLEKAFGAGALPNTLKSGKDLDEESSGSLRHPVLGHTENEALCRIYIAFINEIGPDRRPYSFEHTIIGKHEKRFLESFDGFIHRNGGRVKADILLGFSARQDYSSSHSMEDRVEEGRRKAQQMKIEDSQELIWAWLEADNYQMRRCRDIHRIRLLPGLPHLPNWVRSDIMAMLEKEAMKQVFAEGLMETGKGFALLSATPSLKKALQESAQGNVDELLQQLVSQMLNTEVAYSGAAKKFYDAAQAREKESHKIKRI